MNKSEILIMLKKAENQVRGIQNMVENDRYWIDILLQIIATQSETKYVAISLLENHSKECLRSAMINGNEDKVIQEIVLGVKQIIK